MKLYYLADTSEHNRVVYRSRFMSEQTLAVEQKKCVTSGGGEFVWLPASKSTANLPKDEIYCHIPSLSDR